MAKLKRLGTFTTERAVDRIMAYLTGADTSIEALAPDDQEHLNRMQFCDNQMRSYKNSTQIVEMLQRTFRNKTGDPISRATAYRIISDTQEAFASHLAPNKNYYINLLKDYIFNTMRIAEAKKDVRGMNGAAKNLMELLALNKAEGDGIPADILDRITLIFQMDPSKMPDIKAIPEEEVEEFFAELEDAGRRTIHIEP